MKQELKQHIINTLDYLKDTKYINDLTIIEIEEKIEVLTDLLRTSVELVLNDEEGQNGTMTSWWLYDNVKKIIYAPCDPVTSTENIIADLTNSQNFVEYMITKDIPHTY